MRQERKSELDDLNRKYQAELNALRTKLEEMQANHRELVEKHTKDLEDARRLATEEAQTEAVKNSEQDESTHAEALQALEERLAHEQEQNSSARNRVDELIATLAEVQDKLGQADGDRSRLEDGHADVLARRDQELHGKDQVIDNLKAELQRLYESKEEELEAAKTASKKSSSELDEENSRLKSKLQAAISALEDKNSAHEDVMNEKDKELSSMSEKLRDLEGQLHTLSDNNEHENATRTSELRKEHEKNMIDLKKEHDAALASLSDKHTAALETSNNELEELRRSLEGEKEKSSQRVETARSELSEKLTEMTARKSGLEAQLEQVNADHAEQLDDEREKRKALERQLKEVRDSTTAAINAAKEETSAMASSLEEKLKAAEVEAQENKKLSEDGKQAFKDATDEVEALKKALETFTEEHQAKDEQHTAILKDLKSEMAAASMSLEQSTHELESARKQHNKEMQDLQDQQAVEKQAIEDSAHRHHQTAVDEVRAKYDDLQQNFERVKKEHASELEARKAEYTEMMDVQASLAKEMSEMENGHAKELEDMARDLESRHTKTMKDAEAAAEEKLSEAEGKHSRDLEKLVNEHQETYSRLRKELEEDKAKEVAKEVAKAQKGHDAAMEEMRAAMAELRTELEQEKVAATRISVEVHKVHEAALDELKLASDKAIAELQETHEAVLEELGVELCQAKAAAATTEKELEVLRKVPPKIDEEEAAQLKKDLESARTELKQANEKLTAALQNAERLKAQHDEAVKEVETVKTDSAGEERSEAEPTPNNDAELKTQIDELQSAVDATNKENNTLKDKLQKAENAAERHALKLRELEAAYKVTSAELTEMQTKRSNGADYCASPTPKSGLPLSKWADTSDVGDSDGKEGDELGSSIEGTVGGPFTSASIEYVGFYYVCA